VKRFVRAALRRKTAAAGALVLVMVIAGTVVAGSGLRGTVQLGVSNTISGYATSLVATAAGKNSLQLYNQATTGISRALYARSLSPAAVTAYLYATAGIPLQLQGPTTKPPMVVNSSVKVGNLNADQLDGKDSTGFYAAGSKVADSVHADQADSAAFASGAQNSNQLGGQPASSYVRKCMPGSVRGWARIAANPSYPSSYATPTAAYNCAGFVQARRAAAGTYIVDFQGLNSSAAVGTVFHLTRVASDDIVTISMGVDGFGDPKFWVEIRDADGGLVDLPFVILAM
jgi:hypothetical protein